MKRKKGERIIAKDIMLNPTASVFAEDNIREAVFQLTRNHQSYVPVKDETGLFLGIITVYDILDRLVYRSFSNESNSDYINPERYLVLGPDDPITKDIFKNRIGCVCKDGILIGFIEESSFERHYEWNLAVLERFEKQCEEYELIFKNYYDSIYDIAGDGTLIFASSGTDRHIGKDSGYVQGRNILDLEHEKLFFPSIFHTVMARKETSTIIQNIENDRKAIVTGVPVFDSNNEIIRVIVATRDVDYLVESIEHSSLIHDMNELKEKLLNREKLVDSYFSEIRSLRTTKKEAQKITTKNTAMQKVLDMSKKVASTDSSVLILGESGTGKDLIANMIHNMSSRSAGPYIKINCGAIPENILESELFGYEAGAFTGANRTGKAGLMELADGGTLFLNEIGEMPLNLQVKLLQAIQDKKFMHVGGSKEISVDIRIISATNIDLVEAVRNGSFREDLYYRLNVVPIEIPALRNRKEDIPELSMDFLTKFNNHYARNKHLSSASMRILLNYDWPGNVRELENLIERLVVVSENETISAYDFPAAMQIHKESRISNIVYDQDRSLKENMDDYEKEVLRLAYAKYKNTTQMAYHLDVNQSTIARKMKKYGLY